MQKFLQLLQAQPEAARDARHRGARQDAGRRDGLGAARHRSGRVRLRHPASAEGRVLGERRHRRRHAHAAPAARRVRRHHAVQLPGDGAAVDVPGGDRLRQHLRPEAFGESAVGVDAHGRAVQGSRPARRRAQRRARRQGGGRRDARTIPASRRCRSSARRRSPSTSTRPARSTASACRRWAARRTTRSCCPTPISSSPPTR